MVRYYLGCVVNIPLSELILEHCLSSAGLSVKVPFLGVIRRSLALVTTVAVTIPALDDANPRATRVKLFSHGFAGDATGSMRQSPLAVSFLAARDHCQLRAGLGEVGFCNLSHEAVAIPAGTLIADWHLPEHSYVITLPDGSELRSHPEPDNVTPPLEEPVTDPPTDVPV